MPGRIVFALVLLHAGFVAADTSLPPKEKRVRFGQEFQIRKGQTVELDDGLKITFIAHGHKRTMVGGPRSPLIIHLTYRKDSLSETTEHHVYPSPEAPAKWTWKSYEVRLLSYKYDEEMVLVVRKAQPNPLGTVDESKKLYVDYVRQWHYRGHPDTESFIVDQKQRFTYDLQTDYPTSLSTRTLTAVESDRLQKLISAVRAKPVPPRQQVFPNKPISGRVRISSEPPVDTEFLDSKPPTPEIEALVRFLRELKK